MINITSHYFIDDKKTSDDVKKEGEILTEMLEIVAKRDSLIALLEEERQRWCRSSYLTCITSIYMNACYIRISKMPLHNSEYLSCTFRLLIILFMYIFLLYVAEIFINCNKELLAFFEF